MDKINVTRSSMPPFEEYVNEIKDLWDSRWLTNCGEKHNLLMTRLGKYLGVKNVELFVNGHLALEMIISAMGLTGEVITTPFTFASTTHAITRCGLTPVFCDVNPDDYTIDVTKIESLITDKTSAIIPVHVYGNICDYKAIDKIAKKHNLKVIYDAAHAFGVTVDGIGAAALGDASMFSFHATKVYNTIEGGMISCDDEYIHMLRKLRNFGIESQTCIDEAGSNAKMNEFSAAMGLCNLRHLDEEIAKRKAVCDRYDERLGGIDGIKIIENQPNIKRNYAYYPVVFSGKFNRDEVSDRLQQQNITARKYFYPLTNEFDCYKNKFNCGDTPVAKYLSENVLCLPIYADLDLKDVDRICDIILEVR